ncbi:MAG: hypothetical protein ACREUV_01870 [Burkholderiales bacterium]
MSFLKLMTNDRYAAISEQYGRRTSTPDHGKLKVPEAGCKKNRMRSAAKICGAENMQEGKTSRDGT